MEKGAAREVKPATRAELGQNNFSLVLLLRLLGDTNFRKSVVTCITDPVVRSFWEHEFAGLPRISIDYAILEKATNRVVVEADLGWLDIGDWAAVYSASPKDAEGNSLPDGALAIDTRGTHASIGRPGKVVATIGLEDIVVVDTEDALLIARRDRSQDVKRVIDALRERGLERHL